MFGFSESKNAMAEMENGGIVKWQKVVVSCSGSLVPEIHVSRKKKVKFDKLNNLRATFSSFCVVLRYK